MKQSNFLSLNVRDLVHVLLVGLGAFLLNFFQETFIPSLNVSPEIKIGLTWVIAYIGKKFFDKPAPKPQSLTDDEIGLPIPRDPKKT